MVTATADIVLERAEGAARAVGADLVVPDCRRLLDHVDATLVALPHPLHHEAGSVLFFPSVVQRFAFQRRR